MPTIEYIWDMRRNRDSYLMELDGVGWSWTEPVPQRPFSRTSRYLTAG